jgi:lipopolysaccharide transport system ATP-binding protein
MSSPVISVSHLGKRYWLRHQSRSRYRSLRDDIAGAVTAPARALARMVGAAPASTTPTREEFWALRDVSFEVQRGEVVGIIGGNGAGKSTLLKILSRITEPTAGRVEIDGRVASLLEVGTGFHPELTGRENIFLNGAIMGMSRLEIRAKFDEIVAFAEVERFLDTPVKRYSSGMYVRLAFAVAAHLDPEILVVDEVLAVGDAQFQKKCLGKIQDVSSAGGRTVLFVSHQMGTIRQLCSRAILLKAGQVAQVGSTESVIDAYVAAQLGTKEMGFVASASALHKDIAIERSWATNQRGEVTALFVHTEPINIHVKCLVNSWVANAELRLVIGDARGRRVFTSDIFLRQPAHGGAGSLHVAARIPGHFLRPETYFVTLATFVNNQAILDEVHNGFSLLVQDAGSKYAASEGVDYGCVFAPCEWTIRDGEQIGPLHATL